MENSYFLGIETNSSGSILQNCSDDYVCVREEVKFVTFNKNKCTIDGIFDDGVNVPVRPPRRKKCIRRDCENDEMGPRNIQLDETDDERLSYDYTVEVDGVSTTSWKKLSIDSSDNSESDSFTNCSSDEYQTSDNRWNGLQISDSEYGSRISLTVDRMEINSLSYRSINTESGFSQFHSFSSENSLLSSDENVDDIAGLHRLSKSATLLSNVERWLLDIYFSAYDVEVDEDICCEEKVQRSVF